jgi:hypothetical protein
MYVYDIIIIGSGMAGLYAAHQVASLTPNTSVLILEKNKNHDMGGRAGNETFYGTELAIGAGVGRKHKDHRLIHLLKQAKIKCSEFEATRNYVTPFPPVDILKTMKLLKAEYKKHPETYNTITFRRFGIKVLGESAYRQFVVTTGYTDYENADVYETLYKYGMDDNVDKGWTAISIPWSRLVGALHDKIGKENFKFSCEVTGITALQATPPSASNSTYRPIFKVDASSSSPNVNGHYTYYSNKVVVATTISGVKKIMSSMHPQLLLRTANIYRQIHSQAFLMVYAKFDSVSREVMKTHVQTFTVVNGPLQKLIPMNPDKGVYMVAYTDNARAVVLKGHLENTRKNCDLYAKLVEQALGIQKKLSIVAIKSYYWSEGTHYYDPLNPADFKSRNEFVRVAQNPYPGIAVVGEAVSRNQGWVEGALDSVDAVLTKDWIMS